MCHESACHSNISKISQIRIFKANPGATFFFFYIVTILSPVPLTSPEWWRQRCGLPQREAAGTHARAQPPHEHPPLLPNERSRGRRRAALCGFCRSIGAARRALRQAWAVPAGLQAGYQRLQEEASSAAGGGSGSCRPRRAQPCQPLFPPLTQLPAPAGLRAPWNQTGRIIMF